METYSALDRSPTVGREDTSRPFDGYRRRSPGRFEHSCGSVNSFYYKSGLPESGL